MCVGFVCLHLVVNLFLMFGDSVRQTRLKFTRWKLWRKYAQVRGDKMLKFQKKNRHRKFKTDTEKYRRRPELNMRLAELQAI